MKKNENPLRSIWDLLTTVGLLLLTLTLVSSLRANLTVNGTANGAWNTGGGRHHDL